MTSSRRAFWCVIALGCCSAAAGHAQSPAKSSGSGFRLFARSLVELTANRVSCGFSSEGEICTDPQGRSATSGGGFWPKGTANRYVFNSGPQVAGIIGPGGGPWAGDTAGAFFFDFSLFHDGQEVRPIHNATDSLDLSAWPVEARVPSSTLYHPTLHDRISASDGDLWWLMWEGDPQAGRAGGRPHPLGVLVDMRALAWSQPSGNEDIFYVVNTFYNITSLDPADYVAAPPALQPILLDYAQRFHDLNNTHFGITLPPGGYTIAPLVAIYAADMDVASAGTNWSSVHVPLALGHTYDGAFDRFQGWTFDPALTSDPFFPGSGFVGIKFLRGLGDQNGFQLYSAGSDDFPFVVNVAGLYRYYSGTDAGGCNSGDPALTRICYINNSRNFDMRFIQSARPIDLAPGASTSLVAAYVFASPRSTGGCPSGPCADLPPGQQVVGDTAIHGNAALMMSPGVPLTDSVAGYLGFDDADGDGIVTQYEYLFEPRSLFGKALLAQAFFDNQFLTPAEPEAPDFFVIPGDGKVTVMWRPSPSEATGDPYFDVAKDATWIPPGGTVPVPNPLYDPNFRQHDIEGYRVYRGRVEDPDALTLVAQFDYAGTTISDFGGQVRSFFGTSQPPDCAPEVGITTECPVVYDPIAPGVTRTAHNDIDLVGSIGQVRFGDRIALSDGTVLVLRADTAAIPPLLWGRGLNNTGVPFVLVDSTARNSFRYFYSVTAFDVNSWQSGPSTLESSRVLKQVTPSNRAVNYENTVDLVSGIYGRGVRLDHQAPQPTLDAVTGRFSGPFPASNAWSMGLAGFVGEVVAGPGAVTVRLDSLALGSPYSSPALPHQYWITVIGAGVAPARLMLPITQPLEIGLRTAQTEFPALEIDRALAARYGGAGSYVLNGGLSIEMEGPDYHSLYGRGCINGRRNFGYYSRECAYNGSRWFDGPSPQQNETRVDPISGNQANFSGTPMTNFNNAGELTGVSLIHNTQAYQSVGGGEFRPMEGIKSGARRAADFNVYWGAGGTVDSVIDVTHNVPVPFAADHLGGTWGILNPSGAVPSAGSFDGRDELTSTDFHCIPPANDPAYNVGTASCAGGPTYALSRTAVPGPVVPFSPDLAAAQTAPAWPDAGFGLYLSGDIFTIGLKGGQAPAPGRVWALRTYIGGIYGGNGDGGNYGPYVFNGDFNPPRSWTAVGSELRISWAVVNRVNQVTKDDLTDVHPVPDPYYFSSGFDESAGRVIKFVNLPERAIIRIYTSSGVLVALLEHNSTTFGGEAEWNVRNRDGRPVASGVYFYHIESGGARRVGRMTVVSPSR